MPLGLPGSVDVFPNSVTYRRCCNQCLAMAAGTLLICVRAKREIASRCYHLHRFNQRSREKRAMAASRIRHSFHWAACQVSFKERWSFKCLCTVIPCGLCRSNNAFCQRSNQIFVPLYHCASVPCPPQNSDCKAGPSTLWASLRVACEER